MTTIYSTFKSDRTMSKTVKLWVIPKLCPISCANNNCFLVLNLDETYKQVYTFVQKLFICATKNSALTGIWCCNLPLYFLYFRYNVWAWAIFNKNRFSNSLHERPSFILQLLCLTHILFSNCPNSVSIYWSFVTVPQIWL